MVDGIIFDLDGTLADSLPYLYLANRRVVEEYGDGLTRAEFVEMWLRTGEGLRGAIEHKKLPVTPEVFRARRDKLYLHYLEHEIEPVPGAASLVERLHAEGFALALASGSRTPHVELLLRRFGIRERFRVVLGGETVSEMKPEPEIFLKAADELGIDPAGCLVIEDSIAGVLAAKHAGMKCIARLTEYSERSELETADLAVEDLDQIDAARIRQL